MGSLGRVVCAVALVMGASCAWATSVESVRRAGILRCGVDRSEAEYSLSDEHGARLAFDQDFCKAVAVAVLGVGAKVEVKTYPDDQTSLEALKAGVVDLVASVSLDFSHSMLAGVGFTRPLLYDGQAVMVAVRSSIDRPEKLGGKTVCFLDETEGAESVRGWFAERRVDVWPYPFQEQGEMEAAFVTGNCAAMAGDWTRLAVTRMSFGAKAGEYVILPERMSKDPLGAAFLSRDEAWGKVVSWVLEVLVQAEESGVTSANVEAMRGKERRLLGESREVGGALGLREDWVVDVVKVVGNYGEMFERDLGGPLKVGRGRNGLVRDGGLMEALPLK